MKIIVIDDHPEIGMAFRESLPETDTVSAALNYTDGISFIAKEKFDGVILDTCEPDGEIRKMIERIRECSPLTVIVVFSGRVHTNGAFDNLGVFAVVDKSEGVDAAITSMRRAIGIAAHVNIRESEKLMQECIEEIQNVQRFVGRSAYAR